MTNPTPNHPWPTADRLPAFYGRVELGDDGQPTERWQDNHLTHIVLPYPMRLAWDPGVIVRRMVCHREVATSLTGILINVLAHYKNDPALVRTAGLDLFGGCYNYRPIRGSSQLSLHAYGAAIDLDPDHNPMNAHQGRGTMPPAVIAMFKAEGWFWGGDFKGRQDPMHFEAVNRKG